MTNIVAAAGGWVLDRIRSEPVLTAGLVTASVAAAVKFGWHLTGGQEYAVDTFALALVSWLCRFQVTANQNLPNAPAADQ